jgi:glycosyltransferase involved in cell wall biosynthesis
MERLKIAIIDVIGLTYDATTIDNFGLGGSESAVIYMAKELQQQGFDVQVFNNCQDSRASAGVYDGVEYLDISTIDASSSHTCDVMIVSRTAIPYLPDNSKFSCLKNSAKLKVLWLHDTFCQGDEFVEDLVTHGHIDEIFTLSDFHTSYILNCNHGKRRNFEVLKNKTFITRNGAKCHIDEVDISAKDRNIFIYNASATKGMVPLLNNIWPEIKKHIPAAKLQVIGGYYRFRDNAEPDEQENTVRTFSEREDLRLLDVEFTGIIPQKDIAQRLAKAGFMLFPNAFPETFGISSLESLLYNTPIITNRFGALEETAIDLACYKMDYAIQPNVLFPDINFTEQCRKFIELTLQAYHNPYLHAQKMNYCGIVKSVAGWDTVAMQWKQHLFKKLQRYLPVDEYRKVMHINTRVQKLFNRRYSNTETLQYTTNNNNVFHIITPFFNAESYIKDCILSVATQDYEHYHQYLIDDASTDNSFHIAATTIEQLPADIRKKFTLITNKENKGAVYNHITTIRQIADDDHVIMLLDGDDCLMPHNDLFQYYNHIYDDTTDFTYGSCWSLADDIPLIAQEYPTHVKETRSYRSHKFAWNMPYTHLRTFRKHLIANIPDECFQDDNKEWLKAGGDTSVFYNVLEQCDPNKVKVIRDVVYKYNDLNPLNDYKIHGDEQTETANRVLNMKKQRVLIAVPTAKYIEPETFKSIYDLEIPSHVEVTFQYFFGYQIDQIRNLIAHWAKDFDYLFSVDSDIILPPDTLTKFLQHNVDVVSGVYIQRKPNTQILEIYRKNNQGGVSNVPMQAILPAGLHEIDACGFGCVLVKREVMTSIGYPQFVYKSALDHKDTISEDVYFCKRAQEVGAKIYVDSSVVCDHKGSTIYRPV